jgi:hypothetical protein
MSTHLERSPLFAAFAICLPVSQSLRFRHDRFIRYFRHSRHNGYRCDDGECAECQTPRYRKVLVKKEIVCGEIFTTKCVVAEHVERVPCQACQPPVK